MDLNNILGVVLAGGKSQRFGQNKSQAKLQNKFLIDYILSEIVSEFRETLIISNEPIKFKKNKTILEITIFINKILEKMILKNIDQWIWTHNKWKL